MMTQEIAQQNSHELLAGDISEHLRNIVVKVCLCRLFFLVLILIPLAFFWIGHPLHQEIFLHFREPIYTIFLTVGFALTIFFLLSWPWFRDIIFFFRIQLIVDSLLIFLLLLLTGGITSNFSFLLLGLIFLYGRILGIKTAINHALSVGLFFITTSFLHYLQPSIWPFEKFSLYQLCYYSILQLLGIILVLLLLSLGKGREKELLKSLNHHKIELQRAETLKSQVFDWMNSGLLVVNKSGCISTINRKALEWKEDNNGRPILGQPLRHLFPKLEQEWSRWDKRQILRTEVSHNLESQLFGVTFTPLPGDQGSLILFSDITKIKELEKQVRQMEKLSTIGELASGLAHEIKNPLAGIKASLQLINQDRLTVEHKTRLYQIIQKDIHRLDHLLSNFLLFARPSQPDLESLNVFQTIKSCLETVQLQKQHVNISLSDSLQDLSCSWDIQHFQQVALNILINAAQAVDQENFPHIDIDWNQDHKGTYIAFSDNGPGLDPEKVDLVFDPFVTTKKEGTGLGLAIAQRLAVQNQSWIELHNLPTKGAEARIYITPNTDENQKTNKD